MFLVQIADAALNGSEELPSDWEASKRRNDRFLLFSWELKLNTVSSGSYELGMFEGEPVITHFLMVDRQKVGDNLRFYPGVHSRWGLKIFLLVCDLLEAEDLHEPAVRKLKMFPCRAEMFREDAEQEHLDRGSPNFFPSKAKLKIYQT